MSDSTGQVVGSTKNEDLSNVLGPVTFGMLTENQKNIVLTNAFPKVETYGGLLSRFLGHRPKNVILNITFLICALLLIFIIVDTVIGYIQNRSVNLELVDRIFPMLTLALGYLFGKNSNNEA